MNAPLRKPWTQDQFFAWAEAQDVRHEFDGFRPMAMTGGNRGHSRVFGNLLTALKTRLRGTGCEALGPDAGIETVNKAVRYPDALVTCAKGDNADRLVSGVVVVFEVLSPTSGRIDRIIKVREYAAVPSIQRYVIVESSGIGLTVLERSEPSETWRSTVLAEGDVLRMPEIGIEVAIAEIYEDMTFPTEDVE